MVAVVVLVCIFVTVVVEIVCTADNNVDMRVGMELSVVPKVVSIWVDDVLIDMLDATVAAVPDGVSKVANAITVEVTASGDVMFTLF
jgi:hypothetical protein